MSPISKQADERSAPADALAGGARAATPSSNTGINTPKEPPARPETSAAPGVEFEPDAVVLRSVRGRGSAYLQSIPNDQAAADLAIVDWVAFTVRLRGTRTHNQVIAELQALGLLAQLEDSATGYSGYSSKMIWREGAGVLGLVAWGGKAQRGTVHVSIAGQGCARVRDWLGVHAWLEVHAAKLVRLDLAHDDFMGAVVNIEAAVRWYQEGGFGAGGRRPNYSQVGDWLDPEQVKQGRTFKVGRRASGKECRVYEKGKQLGDEASPWVRVEVEWRNRERVIPLEALTRPGPYLAGAYACLGFLSASQSRIATTQREAKISFERAMANGRHAVGKLLNLALEVFEGDYGEVVEALRREGYPARVQPFAPLIAEDPQALVRDPDQPPGSDR